MIDEARVDRHPPEPVGAAPIAVAVVLHPHPGMGGDRHHPVVVALCEALAARRIAALRLDITTEDPAAAVADLLDAAARARDTDGADLPVVLAGYSWGSLVTAMAGPVEGLAARVLVAPPLAMAPLDDVPAGSDGTPVLVLVPSHDRFGPPDAVRDATRDWSDVAVEEVASADHFLVGHAAAVAERTASWVAGQLGP